MAEPKRTITARVTEDVRRRAAVLAARRDQKLQHWVEDAIREKIERDETREP